MTKILWSVAHHRGSTCKHQSSRHQCNETFPMAPKPRNVAFDVPKTPVEFSPTVIINEQANITGTHLIKISDKCVIHPRAKLNSSLGPITIGKSVIVNERALISASDEGGIIIGDDVLIEANAVIEGKEVGAGTDVEIGVKIGKGAVVGKHCKLSPMTEVAEQEVVGDYTVLYGYDERRIDRSGSEKARKKLHDKHIEALRLLVSSNHGKFKS